MKKLITFCLFAVAILFNTQDLQAQNKVELNKKAAETAANLNQSLKLNKDTQEEVYQAYKQYETNIAKLEKNNTATPSSSYDMDKQKITTTLMTKMQGILSSEQYAKFTNISGLQLPTTQAKGTIVSKSKK
ncbi:hypothetical protein [Lacinutrix salivirga]